jgi:hypothetical protein
VINLRTLFSGILRSGIRCFLINILRPLILAETPSDRAQYHKECSSQLPDVLEFCVLPHIEDLKTAEQSELD